MFARILMFLLLAYILLARGQRLVASDTEGLYSELTRARKEERRDKLAKLWPARVTDVSHSNLKNEADVRVAADKLLDRLAGAGLSRENIAAVSIRVGEDQQWLRSAILRPDPGQL